MIDIKKVHNIEIEGVDSRDYPDFCDAFIAYAEDENGNPLTEEELEILQEAYPEVVNELAYQSLI